MKRVSEMNTYNYRLRKVFCSFVKTPKFDTAKAQEMLQEIADHDAKVLAMIAETAVDLPETEVEPKQPLPAYYFEPNKYGTVGR